MENLIRISPDKEKAVSIFKMAETSLEMIKSISIIKFPSNITKEYYEIIRGLISIILLLDGYKTFGEGSHKTLVDYLEQNYKEFGGDEIELINDLRIKRNKIAYDGFFVSENYVSDRIEDINKVIIKLKKIINEKCAN